jgi:hypothetical protein
MTAAASAGRSGFSLASSAAPASPRTHRHGTRHSYTLGCRCRPCTDAQTAYVSRRRRMIAYGRWGFLQSGEEVRRMLGWLRSGGATNAWIGEQLGVSTQRASQLALGKHPSVYPSTVERVAALVGLVESGEVEPPGWRGQQPASQRRVFLDAAPLVERVSAAGGLGAVLPGYSRSTDAGVKRLVGVFHRVKAEGRVSIAAADELSLALLGLHPCEVFGQAWWQSTANEAAA